MALQIYGFTDKTQTLELMIRAHSREHATALFAAYIDQLNAHPVTNIQVQKQIRWGGLTASGFASGGIINGSPTEDAVVPVEGILALSLPGSPSNGAAVTVDSTALNITGDITLIAWIKLDDYDEGGTIISKGEFLEDTSYSLSMRNKRIELTIDDGISEILSASDQLDIANSDAVWVRLTFDFSAQTVAFYRSEDILTTPSPDIVWTHINTASFVVGSIKEEAGNLAVGWDTEAKAGSPDGFIGRAIVIGGIDPTLEPIVDMYPNRDAEIGETQWDSKGQNQEQWDIENFVSVGFIT